VRAAGVEALVGYRSRGVKKVSWSVVAFVLFGCLARIDASKPFAHVELARKRESDA
jgi:hypothetical protein